jgi:hypothetical protein
MQSNDGFDLSIAARNVEARFYNKLGIVYVEGDDDKLFWAQYFNPKRFEIRKADGCKNLEDYEDEIIHHGLKCIVAKDADYSAFMAKENQHPLIVCTLSHSIECVMYCPYNVNACLKRLARTFEDHLDEIKQSYDDFFTDAKDIIAYDIANNVYGVGCSVCGDSCIPFMVSNHSVKVCTDKRDRFIETIAPRFTKEQIDKARELLENDKRELRQIVKGHFQTSFVANLLKKLSSQITQDKAPSISSDALYALLITCFSECAEDCEERKVITQRVSNAVAALRA